MYRVLIFLLALVLVMLGLNYKYPYILQNKENYGYLLQSILILSVLALGLFNKNLNLKFIGKSVVLWAGLALILLTVYSYRHEFKDYSKRILANLSPSSAVSNEDRSISFYASHNGHFLMNATINNKIVHFLLDTGASVVTLTRNDAIMVGINVDELNYNIAVNTANGSNFAASTTLDEIKIGSITVKNIIVYVAKSGLDVSLLGMNFLDRISRYEVSQNKLTLWAE